MKEGKLSNKKIILLCCQFFLFLFNLCASVMEKPRIIHDLRTQYFDILYSKESTETAKLLAENADELYEKAFERLGATKKFVMPVVISPDSDVLSVTYSFYPYNRITIYEGISKNTTGSTENILLDMFYHELVKAIAGSIRNDFDQMISRLVGNFYQPLSLINLPFSFFEGIAFLEDKNYSGSVSNDTYYLQILSQAKYENCFPTWLQASVYNDQDSGNTLALAAGCAFAAYLQQTYGIEKYYEFWQECTKIHAGIITRGIFKKVYKQKLEKVWNDFEQSIPLPETLFDVSQLKKISKGKSNNYRNLVNTKKGLVFYDDINSEVLYFKEKSIHHLFYASKIDKFSVTKDGRFILVDFEEYKSRSNYRKEVSRIYDIDLNIFLPGSYDLRDSCFVEFSDGSVGVAGIDVSNKIPELKLYNADLVNKIKKSNQKIILEPIQPKKNPVYTKRFNIKDLPSSVTYSGDGFLSCLINSNGQYSVFQLELDNFQEKLFQINQNTFLIDSLHYENSKNKPLLTLEFSKKDEISFTRLGYIDFSEEPKLYLQKNDVSGGIHYAVFKDEGFYFTSKKMKYDEVYFTSLDNFEFDEFSLEQAELNQLNLQEDSYISVSQLKDNYKHSFYIPFKYTLSGTTLPLFPVQSFSFTQDVQLWPGLGFTYFTQSDPYNNNSFIISAGAGFIPDGAKDRSNLDNAIDKLGNDIKNSYNDYSFGFLIKNTSTPVDLKFGMMCIMNNEGYYKLSQTGGALWERPVFLNVNKVTLNIQFIYSMSTSYFDQGQVETHPDLHGWTSLNNAYKLMEFSYGAEFSNIHQSGRSKLELFGFRIRAQLYTLWDLYEQENKIYEKDLTLENQPYSQYNLGFLSEAAFPKLLPFADINNMVVCCPLNFKMEAFYENGTSFKSTEEVLLLGYESHNGISQMYLSVARIGLKLGHSYSMEYDTQRVKIPDIRALQTYAEVLDESYSVDNFYLKFVMDFGAAIGLMSSNQLKTEFTFGYLPRTKDFKFNFTINLDL